MSAISDQTARDDVARVLDRTLFVEAGAGTGKTSSLVARVVELVSSGVAIDELAVITFTEAAAAELRDRVRTALEASTGEEWAGAALAGLDGAAISTLHSFAQRILAESALEAGLPPVIEVQTEIGAQVDFEQRWRTFLDQFLEDATYQDVVQRAVVCGIQLSHLKALAQILEGEWDRLQPSEPKLPLLSRVNLASAVESLAAACALADRCRDDTDGMFKQLVEWGPWLSLAAKATDDLTRLQLLADAPRLRRNTGRKTNWPTGDLDQIRELLDRSQSALDSILEARVDEVLRHLIEALSRFTLAGVADRKSTGSLHFHDLLVMCRDLLRDSVSARMRCASRYRYLLIDEFQDTDPIQIEIARLIASAQPGVHHDDLAAVPTRPGALFFVGDAKQSIYRFRRADIELFLSVQASTGQDRRTLSTNFRTVPGVVEWVNRCFTEIMGEGVPPSQPAYQALVAHRPAAADKEPPVVLLGGPSPKQLASERRRIMGDDLAACLRDVVEGGRLVFDRQKGQWRPARWDDIAILLPARTGLPELRSALDRASIPYRIEASSLVWLTQEVRDLLAVLRAVDDPTDELALVAALRSPAFACGDDDLARYVANGGRLDLVQPAPRSLAESDPVVRALVSLRELQTAAMWDEPSALVERVIRERHLMELATAAARPRDIWRRLRFVADQARAYADAEGGTLRDFLDWTELQADEAARVTEAILPETDDDAVRVMTIHASKGLEFPVVAVAGLDRRPDEVRPGARILWGPGGQPEAHIKKGLSTLGFGALKEADDAHEVHEAWRLMYVATTRARDHLILCLHHKMDAAPERNLGARLFQISHQHPDTWRSFVPEDSSPDLEGQRREGDQAISSPGCSREEWIARRRGLLEMASRPSVVAATAVADLAAAAPGVEFARGAVPEDSAADEFEPWRRGRAGTSIGRAVHATLQTVNLVTGEGLADIATAQAAAEGVPGRAREIERAARAALETPAVQQAVAHRYWRELYVGAPIEGVLCEGYLDLLIDGPGGLEIIDYKTDQSPDLGSLVHRYRLQTATYALLVEATMGQPVNRCVLVVLQSGAAREVEVEGMAEAKNEVRSLLREKARPITTAVGLPPSVAG